MSVSYSDLYQSLKKAIEDYVSEYSIDELNEDIQYSIKKLGRSYEESIKDILADICEDCFPCEFEDEKEEYVGHGKWVYVGTEYSTEDLSLPKTYGHYGYDLEADFREILLEISALQQQKGA